MYLPEEYQSFLELKGISLQNPGLEEKALERDDALCAITILRTARIPVSGGDVWMRRNNRVELTYNNWSIKRGDSAEVSWTIAEDYIKNFPVLKDGEPIFVLVPSVTKKL